MKDYEYEDGRCTICHKDNPVRWRNIYLIGSEGIWLCWPCEKDLLKYLGDKSREFHREKIKHFKNKKGLTKT